MSKEEALKIGLEAKSKEFAERGAIREVRRFTARPESVIHLP